MIYLLEDDDNIRKLVTYTLNSQKMETEGFARPSEFWAAVEDKIPELVLLDIMLPEEDGITVLKKIRKNSKTANIPVIMLTAKNTEYDVISGLDAGADDYVTKPFGMMLLLARIKTVLRRYSSSDSEDVVLKSGVIVLNKSKHTVFVGKEQVFLTLKEFDLLALLLEVKGNVITREKLLDSIWNFEADVESRTVDVHIKTLRQKLKSAGNMIETIRGVGYRINADVSSE